MFVAVTVGIAVVLMFVYWHCRKLNQISYKFWLAFLFLGVLLDHLTTYMVLKRYNFNTDVERNPLTKYLLDQFGPISLVWLVGVIFLLMPIFSWFLDRNKSNRPYFSAFCFSFGLLRMLASVNNLYVFLRA